MSPRQRPDDIHAIRVAAGEADLVLGCDLVVAGTKKVLAAVQARQDRLVVNTAEVMPGDFTRNADFSLPAERSSAPSRPPPGATQAHFIDATRSPTALLGNAIAANMFMLGYAFQKGARAAVGGSDREGDRAQRRGGGDEPAAFRWGRRAAAEPAAVDALVATLRRADAIAPSCRSRSTRSSTAASPS